MNAGATVSNEASRRMEAQFDAIREPAQVEPNSCEEEAKDVVSEQLIENPRSEEYSENSSLDGGDPVYITPPPVEPQVIQGGPPLIGAPPTYSAVMRIGPAYADPPCLMPRPPAVRVQPSPPFIAPAPPPSYAAAQGLYMEVPAVPSLEPAVFGPRPISVVCPRCATVVITRTSTTQSNLTHISALTLCLCGCWPCCLLPYCMESCKNTVHHCPRCQILMGVYHPW